jgi:hypothetical protein
MRSASSGLIGGRPQCLPLALALGLHPLTDHGPLELGKDAHHLKHRLSGRRRRVDTLLVQKQLDPEARFTRSDFPAICPVIA